MINSLTIGTAIYIFMMSILVISGFVYVNRMNTVLKELDEIKQRINKLQIKDK